MNEGFFFRTKSSRLDISDEAARLLTERSVRRDTGLSLFVPPLPDIRLFVGCSESTIEHNIIFPGVRNGNC